MASELEGASDEVLAAGEVLAESEARLPGARQAVDEAAGRVAAAEVVAAEAAREAAEAREALAEAQAEYEEASAAVESAREARASMLVATYRGVELLTLDAVLAAEDTSQALDRLTYLEFMIEGKNQAVEEVTLKRREASNAEGTATVAEAAAAEAEAAAEAALAESERRLTEAEQAQAVVAQLVSDREAALAVAESARDEIQAQYDEVEAESARIAEELRRIAAAQAAQNQNRDQGGSNSGGSNSGGSNSGSSGNSGGSRLAQPVSGWKSSDYGWRVHPIYGNSRFHGGTDFAAATGTAIYAADSGTVVYAGWNGGYGQFICVDHGGGLSSCYAHLSHIGVAKGQWVQRNSKIGELGTTGTSTGPHLHLEVRVNGERVNPLGYLPSCLCR
jgi:murein DD-endopeptidase MepM/ murein hydrolase activator NlpD